MGESNFARLISFELQVHPILKVSWTVLSSVYKVDRSNELKGSVTEFSAL